MIWKPHLHSDQDNLQWCWLRAVEWGRWPIFLSQSIAPVLLIWLSWQYVVGIFFLANILWALFIRYNFVSIPLASFGVILVLAKWVVWLIATVILFIQHTSPECWVSLAWPVLIFPLGMFTPTEIGRIQVQFMRALGYEPTQENPLSNA